MTAAAVTLCIAAILLAAATIAACAIFIRRRAPARAGDAELLAVASATHESNPRPASDPAPGLERVAETGELAAVLPNELAAVRARRRR